jgi:hydrogenase/urease accessory protein HupE
MGSRGWALGVGRWALGVGLAFTSQFLLLAHELGTIRTTVTFGKNGEYRAEVTVDREHLPPGFGLDAVKSGSQPYFDGRAVTPDRVEWIAPAPATGKTEPVLRLTGRIPGGARAFAWENRARLGSYLLTLSTEGDATPRRAWEEGGKRSEDFALAAAVVPPTRFEVVRQYLALGYTHILPKGLDHILFVLGIFLLSKKWRPILLQVTAFTVAHTITLGLTIYGVVAARPAVVEPLIALSIVYVAIENVVTSRLTPWRVALVFAFGLVHGMGFAGVLSELGLPRSEFLPALLSFNLGVEAGQLSVIAAAFAAVGLFRDRPWYRARVAVPASVAIAATGLVWAIQRTISTWGRI